MQNYIVITGDVAGFTSLGDKSRENLMTDLGILLSGWVAEKEQAKIFRGDSFQLMFKDVQQALKRIIQIRCWLKMHSERGKRMLDAKMSIGIGQVSYVGKSVLDSDGEAFHLSGRTFDVMGEGEAWRIVTREELRNEEFNVIMGLANVLVSDWTINQAEVIYWVLEDKTQQQMATQLNIAQSAVNNRIKLSKWKEIERAIKYIGLVLERK